MSKYYFDSVFANQLLTAIELADEDVVARGAHTELVITYTNGRKWHQKNVNSWTVERAKGGGFNLSYNYNEFKNTKDASFYKDSEGSVQFQTRLGDVARIEAVGYNYFNTKYTATYDFQPVEEA